MASQLEVQAPPVEPWTAFHARFAASWAQGQHCLFDGPAGSGKTVAARTLARDRTYVAVLGTKPRDPEMDKYLEEGYERVETWPPPRRALREMEDGSIRIVIWPKIQKRTDRTKHREVFARFLDDAVGGPHRGGWTIVADEGLWLSDRAGLGLAEHLSAVAYMGRSLNLTLMMLVQRPVGVPLHTWTNVSHAFLWHVGNTDDVRELASLGTVPPKDVVLAMRQLQGHSFLYLPTRTGGGWAISEVDLGVTG